jgi:hypothetical protein
VGDLAYVAARDYPPGLRVIDVSNPALPVELGALDTPGGAATHDVEVVGDLAYVAAGYAGLRVIDVSDPTGPVGLGAIWAVEARDVEVVGDLAYVADGGYGVYKLRVIDVSEPAFPVELGALRTPRTPYDVEVVGGLAYVADGESGLRIIDFGPEYASALIADLDIKPGSDPNSINPSIDGEIPVAILGSDTFDVMDVDVTTLAFGPDGAAPDHSHGPHFEDVNGDGLPDLMAHFRTEEAGVVFGTLVACVSGKTLDGKPFNGCDAVRTVPDMDGDKLLDTEEAILGTNPLNRDTDGDGFTDGNEVLVMGTNPLNAHDPKPAQTRRRKPGRRRR